MKTLIARSVGRCKLCSRPTRPGQSITLLGRTWVHSDCYERSERLAGR